jgi:hypothetical protein
MLKEVLDTIDLLDGWVTGYDVKKYLEDNGVDNITVTTIDGNRGRTDFITISFPGTDGRNNGGDNPTLGIIGRLGGIGARPYKIGMVSDADGAVAAVASALKLARMRNRSDYLKGDVLICTHICPDAPIIPHNPVEFMGSPVAMATMNRNEVKPEMEAIIVVDSTKGNYILNYRGIAITPTVKEGYILPVSYQLLNLASNVTGLLPQVLPLSQYDITPYGNGLFHINSILQPSVATKSPVIGLAITAESVIPGSATGASQESDIRDAVAFCLEVAKIMPSNQSLFYDHDEFEKAKKLYGDLNRFRKEIEE